MLFQNQDFLLMQFYRVLGLLKINFCAFYAKLLFYRAKKENVQE